MHIMSKIQSKHDLLQAMHAHAIDPHNPTSFMSVLQLRDFAGSTGAPSQCILINEFQIDSSAFDAEPTPIDPRQMRNMVERIYDECSYDSSIPTAVDQLSSRNLTQIYRNAKEIMLANELITPNAFWVWRESARFFLEKYTPPVFLQQLRQMGKLNPSLWWHFPHISVDEPTMVAYTPSPDYGRADRQVRMKIGRYLTQFYSEVLTQNQIRSMANGVKDLRFFMGKTSADFKRIYEQSDVTRSCMGGTRIGNVCGDYHPVEVYGSGDFAMTWLTDGVTDQIVARAIVAYPDQPNNGGHFVRLYGAEAHTLEDKLIEMGYERQSSYDSGLRLLAIQDDNGSYLMPYIDGNERTVSLSRDFWRIGDSCGDYCHDAGSTDGVYQSGYPCGVCGDHTDEDQEDMEYSDYHGMYIGRCCIDDFTRCYSRHGDRDWIENDNVVYCETDGEDYHDAYLDYYGIVYCDTEGSYRSKDECVLSPDDEWMHEEDAVRVIESDGGEVFYHYRDVDAASRVTVQMPSADNDQTVCYIGDLPEDIAQIHDEAPRFVDDYGNEWVSGFATMHQMIRYARDVGDGVRLFRSIEGVPFTPSLNKYKVDDVRRALPAYVL